MLRYPFTVILILVTLCQLHVLAHCGYYLRVMNDSVSPYRALQPHTEVRGYTQGTIILNSTHFTTQGLSVLGNRLFFPIIFVQGIVWLPLVWYSVSDLKLVSKLISLWLLTSSGCLNIYIMALALINSPFIRYMCDKLTKLLIITFYGGSGGSSTTTSVDSSSRSSSSRRKPTKRANDTVNQSDDHGSLDGKPPTKRGRPSMYHTSLPCGPCSVWLQSGRDVRLAQYHRSTPMRHPGHNAQAMSAYVSQPGVHIILQHDSCVCIGCDLDFSRNKCNHVRPRWVKIRDDSYASEKHCILCCTVGTCQFASFFFIFE